MDITPEYIKTCEKAVEIHGHCPENGDFYFDSADFHMIFTYPGRPLGILGTISGYIWLPRQDQLQEMVLPVLKEKHNKIYDLKAMNRQANWFWALFSLWMQKDEFQSNSMEQLWLAFVMKEKYGKTWSGEDWVNA